MTATNASPVRPEVTDRSPSHPRHPYTDEEGNPFPAPFAPDEHAAYTTDNGIREVFFDDPQQGLAPPTTRETPP